MLPSLSAGILDISFHQYEVTNVNESRQLDAKLLAPLGTPLTGLSLDITGTVAFVTSLTKVSSRVLCVCVPSEQNI